MRSRLSQSGLTSEERRSDASLSARITIKEERNNDVPRVPGAALKNAPRIISSLLSEHRTRVLALPRGQNTSRYGRLFARIIHLEIDRSVGRWGDHLHGPDRCRAHIHGSAEISGIIPGLRCPKPITFTLINNVMNSPSCMEGLIL